MGCQDIASYFLGQDACRRKLGWLQEEDGPFFAHQVEEDGSADVGRKIVNWAIYDGEVPVMRALHSVLGWRTTPWWRSKRAWCMNKDPGNVTRWKFPQQRSAVGYSDVEVGGKKGRIGYSSWPKDRLARRM